MIRRPIQVSWIDEIINYFLSDNPGQKKWFTRKMNLLTQERQNEVWNKIALMGYSRPDEKGSAVTRSVIFWSEEEWDKLTELVWVFRQEDPTDTLIGHVKKAMEKLPESRRRNIRVSNELKPLVERLQSKDKKLSKELDDLRAAAQVSAQAITKKTEELEALEKKVLTREEVLGTLLDDEILQRFGQRVLYLTPPEEALSQFPNDTILAAVQPAEAMAFAIKSFFEMFNESQKEMIATVKDLATAIRSQPVPAKPVHNRPSIPMPKPHVRLPKVTVVGLLPDQQGKIEAKLMGRAKFNFVDKNRRADAIPEGQDIVLLAANFISHSMQDSAKSKVQGTATKLVIHHGGIATIVNKLSELLPVELVVA